MSFRSFDDAMRHLNSFTDYERQASSKRAYHLGRMRRLIDAIGRPDRDVPCVHIAGTKGKGSTALMTAAILRGHGLRTGLYTSPHLVHMLERIQVDGAPASRRAFVDAMNVMRPALDRLRPTYFETMTAAAFVIFRDAPVDVAVIEVGLGGRLDATNVIDPVVCGITRIDYDHMDKLGTTLASIAGEKAGIAKPGVDVVTSETRAAALGPIRRAASRLVRVGVDLRVGRRRQEEKRLRFRIDGALTGPLDFALPVLGSHQSENAAVAVGLAERVTALDPRKVARALASVRLPGRVEVVVDDPLVIVDTAHNPFAIRATRAAMEPFAGRPWRVVFGASADKDVGGMIRALRRPGDHWYLTRAKSSRASDPAVLASLADGVATESVGEALARAVHESEGGDAILVTGSFYVAGEALAILRGKA